MFQHHAGRGIHHSLHLHRWQRRRFPGGEFYPGQRRQFLRHDQQRLCLHRRHDFPTDRLIPAFFDGETALGSGVYYLTFPDGNSFGYYSFLSDPDYIYHFDLGYEYVFDANDGQSGAYFYDFASSDFFYTSPIFPFPYLYDFGLNSVVYYYPDPNNPGHYNTDGRREFYVFSTGQIITK